MNQMQPPSVILKLFLVGLVMTISVLIDNDDDCTEILIQEHQDQILQDKLLKLKK